MALPAYKYSKIITALATLFQLGSNYQFLTHFKTKLKIIGHYLKGDIISIYQPSLPKIDKPPHPGG
ncbi:MAG: D-alanyl-D-alanine carboxypeptidase [Arsenophonus sp. NEOnobi-MAG3]